MDLSRAAGAGGATDGAGAGAPRAPWLAPGGRVERPRDAAELAALVADCARAGTPLLPCGAGSALTAGGAPEPCGVAVSLERLAGIVDYAPDDLTVTVRGGASLAELAPVLAARGQWLPGAPAEGTAGGLVAAGWTDPGARALHGLTRERVLGAQAAGADGALTRSGGRTVKNVAGYDLHRLHAGAGGAFGVLTEMCFRLEPLPERRAVASVTLADAAAAEAAWRWLRREGPDPSGLELRAAGDGSARLRAWFLGDDEPVREAIAAARRGWERWGTVADGDADAAGAEDADAAGPWLALRVLTAPSRVFAVQARAADLARALSLSPAIVAYPNDGEVHLRVAGGAAPLAGLLGEIAAGARAGAWHYRIDGQAAGWTAPGVPAWSADPAALRLLARIKAAFDPRGVLRPGSYSAARLAAAAESFAGGAEERAR